MNDRIFIIAEAGVNHNGNIEIAKQLIDKAKEAGADAIKFQTFKTENLIKKNTKKPNYQLKTTNKKETQFEMIKKLELSFDDFKILKNYCDKKEIMFLSTPFDIESAKFLKSLGIKFFKIASGEITNYLLLKEVGSYNEKVILSTGMSNLGEIEEALNVLIKNGTKKENIIILHCNSEYPTPFEDVNLKAMKTIECSFKVNVGYSDHTLGIEVPIAAVAMGAKIIEKHFTLNKNMEGPDHKASLEPNELKEMIKSIRNIEKALGNGIKKPSKSEIKNKIFVRKSIVANNNIKKGEIFTEKNLTIKRPGNGINPMRWNEIIGKKANQDYFKDDLIKGF